jgi:ABC-type sulfate transport system substrate-binding protein
MKLQIVLSDAVKGKFVLRYKNPPTTGQYPYRYLADFGLTNSASDRHALKFDSWEQAQAFLVKFLLTQ